MGFARVVGTCTAAVTVAGCAVLVIGMSRADADRHPSTTGSPTPAAEFPSSIAVLRPVAPSAHTAHDAAPVPVSPHSTHARVAMGTPASSSPQPAPKRTPTPTPMHSSAPTPTHAAAPKPTPTLATTAAPHASAHPTRHRGVTHPAAAPKKGHRLPLRFTTGKATRVITVVAHSHSSTTARLQVWHKAPGGGWLRSGDGVTAHVGSDGLTKSPSEWKSATPIGSFTLTQAFGHNPDPGTKLPYLHTNPADWWISEAGRLYNTHQRCSSHCAFTQGAPNEHLYYETPYYNYAVVINYNRHPVHPGAGSAFFLHVTDYQPTAGCVAIPAAKLVHIMRGLAPRQHPRILIGVH